MTSYRAIASDSTGVVQKVLVREGDYVHEWEPLFLIETNGGAMKKVELGVRGFISTVKVAPGDQVISDMTLAIVEEDRKPAPCD
ncbi:hypothetical protein P4475_02930 [Halalkalibacterium halodurans]|jgi:biotin carboxyl carrier protein|uniref:Biotin-requiring enzyme n=1 Tax=Halalkalibacterium halodurans TaxID=86665 RepID=A0A0M0KFA6_ALKHA|nr:hypothetical protein [Halalkalibacterium halodurans]MED3645790.1 hypothetical protein [Halalkalibacterium halodurans]MED4163728.1 hypothetical protein [Halalkalibacterium halodurans]TES56500.1 hypothetical protein E2L07_04705 [Halalkalibacterium halodurans]TPE69222.1 hypothetical protein AMD02_009335 [Halalkalibacterium halodurans]